MDPLLVDVCVVQKRLCLTSLILTVKRTSNPNFWRTLLGRFYCFDRSESNMEGCVRIQIQAEWETVLL